MNQEVFDEVEYLRQVRRKEVHFKIIKPLNGFMCPELLIYECQNEEHASHYRIDCSRSPFDHTAQLNIIIAGQMLLQENGKQRLLHRGDAFF